MFKRIILLVMDSVGIGYAADAANLVMKALILWAILNRRQVKFIVLI